MKKIQLILVSSFLLFGTAQTYGATKVSDLPAATAVTTDDLLMVVDAPAGTATSKKITVGNFFDNIKIGDPTADTSFTALTFERLSGNQTIAWDETNDEIDVSAPLNVACVNPTQTCLGFTANSTLDDTTDGDSVLYTGGGDSSFAIDAVNDVFELTSSKAFNGSDILFYIANSSSSVTGSDNYLLQVKSADTDQDLASFGDGTNWLYVDSNGGIRWSGTGSLAIPNGTAPTVDAAGETAVDTTDDQLVYYGGAKRVVSYKKSVKVPFFSPTSSTIVTLGKAEDGYTITSINCIVDPADSSESAVVDVQECDSTGDNCSTVDAAITCDNDGAADDGSLSNPSIDAGDWWIIDFGTITGTVTQGSVQINYAITAE